MMSPLTGRGCLTASSRQTKMMLYKPSFRSYGQKTGKKSLWGSQDSQGPWGIHKTPGNRKTGGWPRTKSLVHLAEVSAPGSDFPRGGGPERGL